MNSNIAEENTIRAIKFIKNINKSSMGHFAVLKQRSESDGSLKTIARVVTTTIGEYPRKFSVTSSKISTLSEGTGRTLSGVKKAILRGQIF